MLPLRTTTTGLSLPVITMRPFQSINAEKTMHARFRICDKKLRGRFASSLNSPKYCCRDSNILQVVKAATLPHAQRQRHEH
mmetsp:Transcript_34914/g.52546  ORF Transcript_34914/g.52546 Transcript_34914/m.52546 type:complete len:81 (-) Transcript_34914:52-294(-)